MHLIERYALNTGVKIDRPEVYQDYFPVPFKKFIVFAPLGKNHKKIFILARGCKFANPCL